MTVPTPAPVSLPAGMTMADLFRGVAMCHPHRPALYADGARLSFAELDARTDRIAQAMLARGWGRGATVGVLLPDGVAMVEMLIATAKLGATVLALNWRLAPAELAFMIGDGAPSGVIVSESHVALLAETDPAIPRIVVADRADALAAALGVDGDSPRLDPSHPVDPVDRWYMLYTSGTTGKPKGCQHSQVGYYMASLSLMGWFGLSEFDSQLSTAPLFHVGGLHLFLATTAAGACTVIPDRMLGLEAMLRLVSAEGVTIQSTPILTADAWVAAQEKLGLPLKLRMVIGAGAITPDPARVDRIKATFGVEILLGYGQSEVGGFASFFRLDVSPDRHLSCGKLLPHLHARLVDGGGEDVPTDGTGELLLRGPSVTTGYHNRPDATAAALEGGWLHTGDLFRRDAEGYLFFAGRMKELIKSGGENVYPAEVEAVLADHPAVAECCVIGVADERYGEAVKAMIVLRQGMAATPIEIADFCRGKIAGYKRPRYVEFTDRILRNFQSKPQRVEMSELPVTADQIAYVQTKSLQV